MISPRPIRNVTRRTSNQIVLESGPGPYLAKVVSHLDGTFMGSLKVQLLKTNTSVNQDAQDEQTVIVKYASPFYGVTPETALKNSDGYENTQKSYGFWAVPPDVGTTVLVIFVEGRFDQGYWFACVPSPFMNFMVPDGRASTENVTDGTPENLKGKKLPVGEYNKGTVDATKTDPTLYPKPYNFDFTQVLEIQGLLNDESRGTTTSSSRRDIPSMVFGWNTPGPLDRRKNAPTFKIGPEGDQVDYWASRLGGSSFVMDDGDPRFLRDKHASDGPPSYVNVENGDNGGDETIPQNECIRIRTRTGHQILLHNSEDLIYIGNSRGTAWIELTSDGKIDIHAQDSISVMTDNDLNFTASRDINLDAGRNVNIKASARFSDGKASLNGKTSGRVRIESQYDLELLSQRNAYFTSLKSMDIKSEKVFKLTANDDLNIHTTTNMWVTADAAMHESSGQSWYRQSGSNIIDASVGDYFTQVGGSYNLYVMSNLYMWASAEMHQISTSLNMQTTGIISVKSGGTISVDGPKVDINGGSSTNATSANKALDSNSSTKPNDAYTLSPLSTITLPYVFPGAATPVPYESILTRAPQHEPYTHHENLNPQAFKKEETDRESPGELPSVDRIVSPDTFWRNTAGVKYSRQIVGSGGTGLGQLGSSDAYKSTTTGSTSPSSAPQLQRVGGSDVYTVPGDGPIAQITTKKNGISVYVAAAFQKNFQGFIDDLEATGYEIKVLGGLEKRNAAGFSHPSYHASGLAIDINPSTNPYTQSHRQVPLITDMPANVSQLAAKHGLGWGGNWNSMSDTMHFSMAKQEGGAFDWPRNGLVPPIPDQSNAYVKTGPQ